MRRTPSRRPESLLYRLLPSRQILVRTTSGYQTYAISTRGQILALLGLYLAVALGTFGLTGYLTGRLGQDAVNDPGAGVLAAPHPTQRPREVTEIRLRQMISDLERMGLQQRGTIDTLSELQATLEHELVAAREELEAVGSERDAARRIAAEEREKARRLTGILSSSAIGAAIPPDAEVGPTPEELAHQVTALETQLASTVSERDHLKRQEKGLRWRVDMLETRLSEMRRSVSADAERVRTWIVNQVSAIEDVLATSGVDVDRLIRRVDTKLGSGQGGPLEPVPALGRLGTQVAYEPATRQEMSRLRAAHALLTAMPLVAPLKAYHTTSTFGVRRDPITRRPTMHSGLDFGSGAGAPALATAPGRVVSAGKAGANGNLVELDHGMGLRTRYGHLRSTTVKPGDSVELHQPVGVMGSTGRSTGEHLHYEVRLDGQALDPGAFLEAGRHLRDVFKK
jgi:murein DD-endopeptidase MepM/ murein hydrolase activator NlpD